MMKIIKEGELKRLIKSVIKEVKDTSILKSFSDAKKKIDYINREYKINMRLERGRNEDGYYTIVASYPNGFDEYEHPALRRELANLGFVDYSGDGTLVYEDSNMLNGWKKATSRMHNDTKYGWTARYRDRVIPKIENSLADNEPYSDEDDYYSQSDKDERRLQRFKKYDDESLDPEYCDDYTPYDNDEDAMYHAARRGKLIPLDDISNEDYENAFNESRKRLANQITESVIRKLRRR